MEIWKRIEGWPYEVSNLGRVRNLKGKIRKPYVNERGYLKVTLQNGKVKKGHRINRLVALAFVTNDNWRKTEVNHKDFNKENNKVENLEWATPKQNKSHYVKNKKTA